MYIDNLYEGLITIKGDLKCKNGSKLFIKTEQCTVINVINTKLHDRHCPGVHSQTSAKNSLMWD